MRIKPVVVVRNLGRLSFLDALDVQNKAARHLVGQLSAGNPAENSGVIRTNTLFLVEHYPIYTIGIRNKLYLEDELRLKSLGAEFIQTNRGGLITFHGPGQLVAYPVLYLGDFNVRKSIKWYVECLESTVIAMCEYLGIKAVTLSPYTGVWVRDKKIAAIGVHGSRYVTTHGVAINCDVDVKWFNHITPCGIPDKGVTSITAELGYTFTVQDAIEPFLASFEKNFQCSLTPYV